MSKVQAFLNQFLNSAPAERAQLVNRVSEANTNSGIKNLLSNVDYNYAPMKSPAMEKQLRMRADNIYFICSQLRAFNDFVF